MPKFKTLFNAYGPFCLSKPGWLTVGGMVPGKENTNPPLFA